MSAFIELGVMPEICQSLEKMDWLLPTEIQSEAIPLILGGGDVLMASETGTGKTGAFCIPIVQVVCEHNIDLIDKPEKKQDQNNSIPDLRWVLNVMDRAPDIVLSSDRLMVQSKSGNWQGCRTTKGLKRPNKNLRNYPQLYYEIHFDEPGLARVGWSFAKASLDLGTDLYGWGYGGTAKKSNNRQFTDYGQPYGEKFDIIGCILDIDRGELKFTKNGRFMGVAFSIPRQQLEANAIYPTVCVKNAGCRVFLEPTSTNKHDYKPNECIWVSEADKEMIVDRASIQNDSTQKSPNSGPLAIIIEPSRELAKQTHDCIELFSKKLNVNSVLWVGGSGDNRILNSNTHIVVCTPGRLSEAMSKNQIPLHNVHFFILDEADALLNQGHLNLIKSIHLQLPKMFNTGRRLQTICCSATLHNFAVKKLAQQLMYFPSWIDLKGEDSVPDTVHHVVLRIDPKRDTVFRQLQGLFRTDGVHYKDNIEHKLFNDTRTLDRNEESSEAIKLMKFYYVIKAIENLNMDRGIIFCRTKLDCDNLYDFMLDMGNKTKSTKYDSIRLHSSLAQSEREKNLRDFHNGKKKFLICTDVAARGIDVTGVPYVIQVTLPDDKSNYIHRIGRVGRADRMGLAISLVANYQEKVWYHSCNRRECYDTRLKDKGGCCIWFDELSMLRDIEEHLKCSIQEIENDFKLQVDEYDGKVVYGSKRLEQTLTYEGHVEQLKSLVNNLTNLESKAQTNYLNLYMNCTG